MATSVIPKEVTGLYQEYASYDGSTFNKDFLMISSSDVFSPRHQSAYFAVYPETKSSWSNNPSTSDTFIGYRRVYPRGGNQILVEVLEFYPINGRVWTNFYNNGTWSGWKKTTPS